MNRNVGKTHISQKWSKGKKKGTILKTLIRTVTRTNPHYHVTHNTDLNMAQSHDSPKLHSKIVKCLAHKVAVLFPILAFEIGLGKRKMRTD